MSIHIKKTAEEIKKIERAGKIVASCHQQLKKRIVPGVKTSEIDEFIDWYLTEHGAVPAQKGYKGYPYASCISVNEVACHGFPSHYVLQEGDIVTVDFVADVNGWKADSAWTYIVGNGSEEVRRLQRAAKTALLAGLKAAKAGNPLSAIGEVIEDQAKRDGYSVVTAFAGHGIGTQLHEPPQVLHARMQQQPFILEEGMVITIEPILSAGSPYVYIAKDGWTARTIDHSLTAQFEHTVAITKGAPILLTELAVKRKKHNALAGRRDRDKQSSGSGNKQSKGIRDKQRKDSHDKQTHEAVSRARSAKSKPLIASFINQKKDKS